LSGTTDIVRIRSIPPDATVTVDGQVLQTPATIVLARNRTYEMTVSKPGFLEVHRMICRVGNAISEGNLLVGGMVGLTADQSSGAAFRLYPSEFSVELVQTDPAVERVYRTK
jgi:hypothetical protein